MPSTWSAVRTMWASRGPGLTALYALHRILQALGRGHASVVPYALIAQPIGVGAHAATRDDPRTTVHIAEPGDPVVSCFPRPAGVNLGRWANGAVCYVAEVRGEFAGTIWIQRERYLEDEVRCEYRLALPASCAWDFDVYVEPKYRLGRTMARLWKAVDAKLAAEGIRWSFSRISLFNAASLGSHARMGARPVGHAVFVVLGPWQLAVFDGAPRLHLSLSKRRQPTLLLRPPST